MPVGTIAIASVEVDSAYATISEKSKSFKEEMKLEQIIR
jgi:hypothetical protein